MNETERVVQIVLDGGQRVRDILDDSAGELSRLGGFERGRAMLLSAYQHVGEAMDEIRRVAEEQKKT